MHNNALPDIPLLSRSSYYRRLTAQIPLSSDTLFIFLPAVRFKRRKEITVSKPNKRHITSLRFHHGTATKQTTPFIDITLLFHLVISRTHGCLRCPVAAKGSGQRVGFESLLFPSRHFILFLRVGMTVLMSLCMTVVVVTVRR